MIDPFKLINGSPGDDTIDGAGAWGNILGGDGSDLVTGAEGNDIMDGGDGDDQLLGDTVNDTMTGGDGVDRFNGAEGFDVLTVGAGTDWFVLAGASFDNDRVTDFEDGIDLIVLRAKTGVSRFADITDIRQVRSDVVIETAAGSVGLENTDVANITEDDFSFG